MTGGQEPRTTDLQRAMTWLTEHSILRAKRGEPASTAGHVPKRSQRGICTLVFTAALLTIAKRWK